MTWADWIDAELDRVRAAGQWRDTRDLDAVGPVGSAPDGQLVVSFASNDYLGLTAHPVVIAAAHEALDRWGAGAGSARLITGTRPVHTELERELAKWKRTDRALLFTTGFAANLGVLTTLGGVGTTIVSDELNHASIIDGARLSKAEVAIARHADVDHFAQLVGDAVRAGRRPLVVTDTVFSMDGDLAPVDELIALCEATSALLVIDEAHAVLGPDVESADRVVRVGTLSKTTGALGGFVAAATPIIDLLRNRARSFIFTTGSTPADTAAALAAVRLIRSPRGRTLVKRLGKLVERVRPGHLSPIIPIVLGDEDKAVKASAALLDRGLLVPAIRPPTVAPGSSRLRLTLSAAHTDAQVDHLLAALDELGLADAARGSA